MRRLTVLLGVVLAGFAQAQERDVSAEEAILRGAKIDTDGPALVKFFERRVAEAKGDQQRIDELIEKLSSSKFREREKASKELIAIGSSARPALVRAASRKDLDLRRRAEECLDAIDKAGHVDVELAALRVLRARKPAGASKALLNYLPSIHDEGGREEAMETLSHVGVHEGEVDEAIVVAVKDDNALIRAAALLVLGRSGTAAQRELVRKSFVTEKDGLVRLRAIQGLLAGKDRQAISLLPRLLTDAPMEIATEAQGLLQNLAGEKAPQRELTEQGPIRKLCREEWETWLKDNEKSIELTANVLWQNYDRRAKKVAERFMESRAKADFVMFQKTTAVPFIVLGRRYETREQLDGILGRTIQMGRPLTTKYELSKVISMEEFMNDMGAQPQLRAFFAEQKKGEYRVIIYKTQVGNAGRQNLMVVFVRLHGSQAHVVGMAPLRTAIRK